MSYNAPPALEARRLELSINPEDGSLLTAPLLNVVMAATDGLYNDLYNMVHGQLEVTSAQPAGGLRGDYFHTFWIVLVTNIKMMNSAFTKVFKYIPLSGK